MIHSQPSRLRLSPDSTLRAYLELLRLPNLFTAVADVTMGVLVVRGPWQPLDACLLALLALASTLLYASGVVLNDVFDLAADSQHRPHRPLPSGRIPLSSARRLGWALLLPSLAAAWLAALSVGHLLPGIIGSLLAACIVLYDAYLKRTPAGPLAMGACRALNVLLGMSVATAAWQTEHYLIAGGIGTYVTGVTYFARTEAARSSRLQLALATAVMAPGIVLLAVFPGWAEDLAPWMTSRPRYWGLLMLLLAAHVAWHCASAVMDPFPRQVQSAVKACILSLVALDAAVCAAVRGPYPALAILALLLPAVLLGRWIRLT